MSSLNLTTLLAMAPQPQPGQQAPPIWTNFIPLILLIVVFYFVLIRPQQKKAKDHQKLMQSIKPGDKVVTSSGIIGKVLTVREKTVTIRSEDTKLELTKTAIADIVERNGDVTTP
jgi:preprotein translocase subunit YajC